LTINRLSQWTKGVWFWLTEGKTVIMCLLVIAAAISLGFITWQSEISIRSAGYALQLIGMIFAIRGLLGIREHFGQPLLRQVFLDWLKRFPKWNRNVVINVSAAHSALAGMKVQAEVWSPDNADKSIDERIERIVRNLDVIKQEQRDHAKFIDELKNNHEDHKRSVAEQTEALEKDLRSNLENLHTSDLITSLVGLAWLTVGITMSTLSPELYRWLY
jgi:hypothetical protein